MTTTIARPAPEVRNLPAQWRRSFDITFGMFAYITKWFLLIIAVSAVLGAAIYAMVTTPSVSILQFGLQAGIWFPFSMMIMVAAYLPTLVMHGITRDNAARGAIVTALAAATAFAVGAVAAMLLERFAFDQFGWSAGAVSDTSIPALSNVPGTLIGLLALFTAANVSGLVVSITYYRVGALWGTVALPLTVSPVILTALFGMSPTQGWRPWVNTSAEDIPDLPAAFRFDLGVGQPLLSLALSALAILAFYRLTRTLTIHPKES